MKITNIEKIALRSLQIQKLNEALKTANAEKEAVIQHLLKRRQLDVFEITDKMMLLPRYEYVNRALIGEIVDDVIKIIEEVGK